MKPMTTMVQGVGLSPDSVLGPPGKGHGKPQSHLPAKYVCPVASRILEASPDVAGKGR